MDGWKRDTLGSIALVTVHDEIGLCVNGTSCSNFIEELGGTDIAQLDGRSGKFQILFRISNSHISIYIPYLTKVKNES